MELGLVLGFRVRVRVMELGLVLGFMVRVRVLCIYTDIQTAE